MRKYDNTHVKYPNSTFKSIGQFRRLIDTNPDDMKKKLFRWKQIFIFHYLYTLDKSNRKVVYLKRIVSLLSRLKIRYIFYFTPINYKAGIKLTGNTFIQKTNSNIKFVMQNLASLHYETDGIIKDYSRILTQKYFFHTFDGTEHLNEFGRSRLATKICEDIALLLP